VARRQAERLRRGLLPIEGRLDLHGHRQDEAERELADFLARAQAADKRCVLVVTGKGSGKAEAGVLRRMVPLWLNRPPNRARILAFAQAQPKDGGLGALYLLLKRRRGV
jgi:DNA-nicking Smr family endonuclease